MHTIVVEIIDSNGHQDRFQIRQAGPTVFQGQFPSTNMAKTHPSLILAKSRKLLDRWKKKLMGDNQS